jgi:hypothetical protein
MKDPKKFAAIESDLTFVGLAGIKVSFFSSVLLLINTVQCRAVAVITYNN